MGEGLVKFFTQRLDSLLLEESLILSGLEDRILSLKNKLVGIGIFFEKIDQKVEKNDEFLRHRVQSLKDIVYKMDDHADEFIIQMEKQSGSNRQGLVDNFSTELEKIEISLSEFQVNGEEMSSAFFRFTYSNLPYYLQNSLMYCSIFPENYQISKGRLSRQLFAEGLVQARPGEILEAIAKENIEKLIEMKMIHVVKGGTKFIVPFLFRKLLIQKMLEEEFVTACTSSDTDAPLTARRISIHSDCTNIPSNLNSLPLRSLFIFGINKFSEAEFDSLRPVFHGPKFIRVLDLQDVNIKSIPEEVGDLLHLKYLGLMKSGIDELPETVCNLRNLQTLDVRQNGNLESLPSGIVNLLQLRHLKMLKNWGVRGMVVPPGIGQLENLQTLTGVYVGGGTAPELGSLTQLRRLGVMDLDEDHATELYESLTTMTSLLSLSLQVKCSSFWGEALLSLELLSPPPLMEKLQLEGRLETLPSWFTMLENLSKLRLGFSHMSSDNSISSLQLLPNLKHLTLWHTLEVKQMGGDFCSAGGFPKLEVLVLASHVLEEWTELEEGAFPSLKNLNIHNCLKLRMFPEGLQHVSTLEELLIMPLLDEHEQRLRSDGGEENYKIKHIPRISFMQPPWSQIFQVDRDLSQRLRGLNPAEEFTERFVV